MADCHFVQSFENRRLDSPRKMNIVEIFIFTSFLRLWNLFGKVKPEYVELSRGKENNRKKVQLSAYNFNPFTVGPSDKKLGGEIVH